MPSSSAFGSLGFLQCRQLVSRGIAGGGLIDGLLFTPAIQTDARRQSNSDSHRAENQCGIVLTLFSVATGCDVVSTASTVSSTTAEVFLVPSLWLPVMRVIVMPVKAHRCQRYRRP